MAFGASIVDFLEFLACRRFIFISAHMHSGQNGVDKRNNDFQQIYN